MTDFKWKMPNNIICENPETVVEFMKYVSTLQDKLQIAVDALESIAAFHLSDNDLNKLGQDEAVHDTELARWALKKITGEK